MEEKMNFDIVSIQTTSICNARCVMCPYTTSYYGKHPHKMNDKLFNKILFDLKGHTTKKICLYSLNEPLTDEKLEERLQLLSMNFPTSMLEISTNMSLCTTDRAKQILDIFSKHPSDTEIWISHQRINKESFERIMGLDYEKTLDNIINLIKLNDGRVRIKIRGLGSSRDEKIRYFTPEEYTEYWVEIFDKNNLNLTNIWIDSYGTFHNRAGNVKLEGWKYQKSFGLHPDCYRLKNLHVDNEGLVVACCMDYEREEAYGDMNKQTIRDVFYSKEYDRFVNMAKGNISSPDDFICKKCMSPGG